MAAAITAVVDGTDTSGAAYTTASISTWSASTYGLFAVGFDTDPGAITVTSTGTETWSQVGSNYTNWGAFGGVRTLAVFISNGAPSTGTITVTPTNLTFTVSSWFADEVTGSDGTTDTAVNTGGSATAHTSGDVGTIDAGDIAYMVVGNAANTTFTNQAGTTILAQRQDSPMRQAGTAYSTTDDTPGVNGANNVFGIIAFIINVAAAGGPSTIYEFNVG